MSYKGFVLLFAVIALAVAAPAHSDNQEEEAKTQSETADLLLDIAGTVFDFAKRRNSQEPSLLLANLEAATYKDEKAQIESLSNILQYAGQYLSNLVPNNSGTDSMKILNLLIQFLTTLNSGSGNGDIMSKLVSMLLELLATPKPTAETSNELQVQADEEKLYAGNRQYLTEEEVAKIEGFRNFLSKALRLVDNKLKPSSRTPQEDEEAVDNPTKWTDLGRNLLRVLRDKVDRRNGGGQE